MNKAGTHALLLVSMLALLALVGCEGQVAVVTTTPTLTPTLTPHFAATAALQTLQAEQTALAGAQTTLNAERATLDAAQPTLEAGRLALAATQTPLSAEQATLDAAQGTLAAGLTALPALATDQAQAAQATLDAVHTLDAAFSATNVAASDNLYTAAAVLGATATELARPTATFTLTSTPSSTGTPTRTPTPTLTPTLTPHFAATAALQTLQAEQTALAGAQATLNAERTLSAGVSATNSAVVQSLRATAEALAATVTELARPTDTPTPAPTRTPALSPSPTITPTPTQIAWRTVDLPALDIRLDVPTGLSGPEQFAPQGFRFSLPTDPNTGISIEQLNTEALFSGASPDLDTDAQKDPLAVLNAVVDQALSQLPEITVIAEVQPYTGLDFPAAQVYLYFAGQQRAVALVLLHLGGQEWLALTFFSPAEAEIAAWIAGTLPGIQLLSGGTATPGPTGTAAP